MSIEYPKKHLFVQLAEYHGGQHELQCISSALLTVDANVLPEEAADIAAKNWVNDSMGVKNAQGHWEFQDGIITVCVHKVVALPLADYDTLRRYIDECEVQILTENYYAKN